MQVVAGQEPLGDAEEIVEGQQRPVWDPRTELTKLKQQAKAGQAPDNAANADVDDAKTEGTLAVILKSAPSKGFANISLLSDLDRYAEQFEGCNSKAKVAGIEARANAEKTIILNLINAVKSAATDLYSARTNTRRQQKEKEKAGQQNKLKRHRRNLEYGGGS